jgi:hypothetical protein
MKFGNSTAIGRYIVDIDGVLRATDQAALRPQDILALSGRVPSNAQVIWDIYDETIVLGPRDQIPLDEQTVMFFRIREYERSPTNIYLHGISQTAARHTSVAKAA